MNLPTKLLFLTFFFLSGYLFAEKAPVRFGNVSMDELKMTRYEPDTSAMAVVLCDYGYFNSNNFQFTKVTRIKILKKEGLSNGSMVFPAYMNTMVRGITFNLENDKIAESKLKSESIFRERVYGQRERIRIAMPNVKVGSVLDIECTFIGLPEVWEFQSDIPVKHSELIIEDDPRISFRKTSFGHIQVPQVKENHWVANEMPAFKPEPYISSPRNYISKVEFDILFVHIGNNYESVTTTWESLCNFLYEQQYFGIALRTDAYLNKTAREILSKAKTDEEKLRMAFDFIHTFKWNEAENLFVSKTSVSFALNAHSGNSADINMALVQLLRKLGFDVSIILMSSRDNGFLNVYFPSLNKLNYFIAGVKLNGKMLLLDGTEAYAPYNLLPERALNLFGRTYDTQKSEIINLETDKKDKETVINNLILNDSLTFSGMLTYQRFDYAALDFRKKYHSFSSQEAYLEEMMKENPGLKVKKFSPGDLDSLSLPVNDKYEIKLTNRIDDSGENLYFYPIFFDRITENPFKVEQRNYPVDFVHQYEKSFYTMVSIPDDMEIVSVPKAVNKRLPENSAYFSYQSAVSGNVIQISYKYGINKTVFPENEYVNIKEFFNQMIAKHAEPIVLKRK